MCSKQALQPQCWRAHKDQTLDGRRAPSTIIDEDFILPPSWTRIPQLGSFSQQQPTQADTGGEKKTNLKKTIKQKLHMKLNN